MYKKFIQIITILTKITLYTILLIFTTIGLIYIFKKDLISQTLYIYHNKNTNKFSYKTINIYVPQNILPFITQQIDDLKTIKYQNINKYNFTQNKNEANLYVSVSPQNKNNEVNSENNEVNSKTNQPVLFYQDIYVPVGHFYWIKDNFDSKTTNIYCLKQDCKLLEQTYPNYKFIQKNNKTELLNALKSSEKTPALINLNDLNPEFKLLTFNKKYYLDDFDKNAVFMVNFYIQASTDQDTKLLNATKRILKNNPNLHQDIVTLQKQNVFSFIQTGVTAISRALAQKMEAVHDMTYPAKDIKDFLKNADLTHTSNEVSFVKGCVPQASMRFCANPQYYELLKYIDLDIVELTGNHNNDYGADWNAWTIKNFYKKDKIDYFGGGLNDKDASKILYKTIKDTKIALLGYNYYDTIYNNTHALATSSHAGANSFSFAKLKKDIATAKKNADIVIVDFQFQECYCYPDHDVIYPICYKPLASPDQRGVFKKAVDYGADIVVGTQAHQPQTYEIYKGKPIFYGLGNLFFDQIYWIGTRQGLILKHYFYNGKYIQTRIITTLQSKDQKQHIVWDKDRTLLLKLLKENR